MYFAPERISFHDRRRRLRAMLVERLDARVPLALGVGDPPPDPIPECTLRAAISQSNGDQVNSFISFATQAGGFNGMGNGSYNVNSNRDLDDANPNDGVCFTGQYFNNDPSFIQPNTELPTIVKPVQIVGNAGNLLQPLNEVNGKNAGKANGFKIAGVEASGTSIKNLSITEFELNGILINGSNNNQAAGAFIGVDKSGTFAKPNKEYGVKIVGGENNVIGRDQWNVISGNTLAGVYVLGGKDHAVGQNYIGTDRWGEFAIPNGKQGVLVEGATTTSIGASDLQVCNVFRVGDRQDPCVPIISGNTEEGVKVTGSDTTLISTSRIGTDRTGNFAVSNQLDGVFALQSPGLMILASTISGNNLNGVTLKESGSAKIESSVIGLNSAGLLPVSKKQLEGLSVIDSPDATISANTISSNLKNGIHLTGAKTTGARLRGNRVGTDVNVAVGLGNQLDGILVDGGAGGVVIGTDMSQLDDPGFANFISANGGNGVTLDGVVNGKVSGNYIGTNLLGAVGLGNAGNGIQLKGSSSDILIGLQATIPPADAIPVIFEGNVISGNANHGILIESSVGKVTITGNKIGSGRNTALRIPNQKDGISNLGQDTRVGTDGDGGLGNRDGSEGNFIGYNGKAGVRYTNVTKASIIAGNTIFANTESGIVLEGSTSIRIGTDGNGTSDTVERNIISGNRANGITLDANSSTNKIAGNFIGTPDGVGRVPAFDDQQQQGVALMGAPANIVGANVIAGNLANGVLVAGGGAAGNAIVGNKIGLDFAGNAIIFNGLNGVLIDGAPSTVIDSNVITGNLANGVMVTGAGATGTLISNNIIGMNQAGTAAVIFPGLFIPGTQIPLQGNAANGVQIDQGVGACILLANFISGNTKDGVLILNADNELLQNRVGTNKAGTAAVPNLGNGVHIVGAAATGNVLDTNLISGNKLNGVRIVDLAAQNKITHCNIGVDLTGTIAIPNGKNGVEIGEFASVNRVEDSIVSGNTQNGIEISGAAFANTLSNNFIGVDASGMVAIANGVNGVLLSETMLNMLMSNTISGNGQNGVEGDKAVGNNIVSNRIGVGVDGVKAIANGKDGIELQNQSAGNFITLGNVISGNKENGIELTGLLTSTNLITGNRIGTDALGTKAVANGKDGILITDDSSDNTISDFNVISGNGGVGVHIDGTEENTVSENFIGTDALGSKAIANAKQGVLIELGGSKNQIKENVISGNTGDGVTIQHLFSSENKVTGNKIGTDALGVIAVPNANGVNMTLGATNNTIDGNTISGNKAGGVLISISGTSGNKVSGNKIGVNLGGGFAVPNVADGVLISLAASDNVVGDSNTISGNGGNGVRITGISTVNNTVSGSKIGVDITGGFAIANTSSGVLIDAKAANNRITANTISGNKLTGVYIKEAGTDGNVVSQNTIGLGSGGGTAVPNLVGLFIENGPRSTFVGPGNTISGNTKEGVIIRGATTKENSVVGNSIGTNAGGTLGRGNGTQGVLIDSGANLNLVSGNTISGQSAGAGVKIDTAAITNTVTNNIIGLSTPQTIAIPNQIGVEISGASKSNLVGLAGAPNVISGNVKAGVSIHDLSTSLNLITANFIGTNSTGSVGFPNADGVAISLAASSNDVNSNTISANSQYGVRISDSGTSNNSVVGNTIGLMSDGLNILANKLSGVLIEKQASSNRIGTDVNGINDLAERNVISGNLNSGVEIQNAGTTGNLVSGNYIGVDRLGATAKGNTLHGVLISGGATFNIVGSKSGQAVARNVLSGNKQNGVQISGLGTNSNRIAGNYIGTSASGLQAIPNQFNGILVSGQAKNNILGTNSDATGDATEGNVVSGNTLAGIRITNSGTTGNVVAGNLVGLNANGAVALPNALSGIIIEASAASNRIGTDANGTSDIAERNTISGNTQSGISILGTGTSANVVAGNYVGLDRTGVAAVANTAYGIYVASGAANNTIGLNSGNVIAFNTKAGVKIEGVGVGNSVRRNSIYSNGGLGIDLGTEGVTLNDVLDSDTGSNNLQNFATIASISKTSTSTVISVSMSGTPNTAHTVDLYSSPTADPSGYGEGQVYLGTITITTGATGTGTGSYTHPALLATGSYVAATATVANSTSEFSVAVIVPAGTGGGTGGGTPIPSFGVMLPEGEASNLATVKSVEPVRPQLVDAFFVELAEVASPVFDESVPFRGLLDEPVATVHAGDWYLPQEDLLVPSKRMRRS